MGRRQRDAQWLLEIATLKEMADFLLAVHMHHIIWYLEQTDFFRKLLFRDPGNLAPKKKKKKILPFFPCIINMLMLGFWEVPFVHNMLICHANFLCFNPFWCVCSRTTKTGNGMQWFLAQWVIGYNNFPLCQQTLCHNRYFNCGVRCSVGSYWLC